MKKLLLLLLFLTFSLSPSFSITPPSAPVAHVNTVKEVVYVTKTGSKYHKSTCHYLKKSKIKTNKSAALNSGYSACSVCKPG